MLQSFHKTINNILIRSFVSHYALMQLMCFGSRARLISCKYETFRNYFVHCTQHMHCMHILYTLFSIWNTSTMCHGNKQCLWFIECFSPKICLHNNIWNACHAIIFPTMCSSYFSSTFFLILKFSFKTYS